MGLIQVGRRAEIKESCVHVHQTGESCEGERNLQLQKEEKGRRPRLKHSTETSWEEFYLMRSKIETWQRRQQEELSRHKKQTRSCSSSSTQGDEWGGWSLKGKQGGEMGLEGGWATDHRGEWGGGSWPSPKIGKKGIKSKAATSDQMCSGK